MYKYKNPVENTEGSVDCLILIGDVWCNHTMDPSNEYELDESTEWEDVIPLSQEVKDSYDQTQLKQRCNAEARQYLSSTDWYVTRNIETGEPIPQAILDKRAEARLKVVDE